MTKNEYLKLANDHLNNFYKSGKDYNFKASSTKLEVTEVKKSTAPEWFKNFEHRLVSLEEDRKKAPEWFKDFERRLVSLEEDKKKAPEWFKEFADKQEKFNHEIKQDITEIKVRLDVIEDKLERNNIK